MRRIYQCLIMLIFNKGKIAPNTFMTHGVAALDAGPQTPTSWLSWPGHPLAWSVGLTQQLAPYEQNRATVMSSLWPGAGFQKMELSPVGLTDPASVPWGALCRGSMIRSWACPTPGRWRNPTQHCASASGHLTSRNSEIIRVVLSQQNSTKSCYVLG